LVYFFIVTFAYSLDCFVRKVVVSAVDLLVECVQAKAKPFSTKRGNQVILQMFWYLGISIGS